MKPQSLLSAALRESAERDAEAVRPPRRPVCIGAHVVVPLQAAYGARVPVCLQSRHSGRVDGDRAYPGRRLRRRLHPLPVDFRSRSQYADNAAVSVDLAPAQRSYLAAPRARRKRDDHGHVKRRSLSLLDQPYSLFSVEDAQVPVGRPWSAYGVAGVRDDDALVYGIAERLV